MLQNLYTTIEEFDLFSTDLGLKSESLFFLSLSINNKLQKYISTHPNMSSKS